MGVAEYQAYSIQYSTCSTAITRAAHALNAPGRFKNSINIEWSCSRFVASPNGARETSVCEMWLTIEFNSTTHV